MLMLMWLQKELLLLSHICSLPQIQIYKHPSIYWNSILSNIWSRKHVFSWITKRYCYKGISGDPIAFVWCDFESPLFSMPVFLHLVIATRQHLLFATCCEHFLSVLLFLTRYHDWAQRIQIHISLCFCFQIPGLYFVIHDALKSC